MSSRNNEISEIIDKLFRIHYGPLVSYLVSKFGITNLEKIEDSIQSAFSKAFSLWGNNGIPTFPEKWLFVVAKNDVLNKLKRESKILYGDIKEGTSKIDVDSFDIKLNHEIKDSILGMMVVCSKISISAENRILLILNVICGMRLDELARGFFVEKETLKKRLYRCKKKLRSEAIDLSFFHQGAAKAHELDILCNTLYLLYNEGYNSTGHEDLIRKDICFEAMRLCKSLMSHFPEHPKIYALFALMCFHTARFESRIDKNGAIVLFHQQDRSKWNVELINAGLNYLGMAQRATRISSYHIEAGIAAEHCISPNFTDTNWNNILGYYKELYVMKPSHIIKLNIAVVNHILGNSEVAIIALLDLVSHDSKAAKNYLVYATLGEILKDGGQVSDALRYYRKAMGMTSSKHEKELLEKKIRKIQ